MAEKLVQRARAFKGWFRKTFPHLLAHKLVFESPLPPEAWLKLLQREASPMSDLGKSWGVKPVVAAVDLPTFTVCKHHYKGMLYDPFFTGVIHEQAGGTVITGEIKLEIALRAKLVFCMMIAPLMSLLFVYSIYADYVDVNVKNRGTDQFVSGIFLIIVLPLGAWVLNSGMRKNFDGITSFLTEFIASKLSSGRRS